MVNQLNINQYMYNVYDEFTERSYINAINFSNNNGLIIRYFKIDVDESYNFDSETSIQTDYKNFKYTIYDFIPIIDAQPPVSQSYFDPTIQGTSYNVTMTLTIAAIQNPLPGDLFHYYDISGKKHIDNTEIFRVRNVNYIRSINNKFPIYQLEVEYAPMKRSTLDEIAINNVIHHYYWDNETNSFIDEKNYKYFDFLNKRDIPLNEIYNLYDETKAGYPYCKLNSLFKLIQKKNELPIKIISPDISFVDYSFKEFLGYFSFYYKLKNINPIDNDLEFPEIDNILQSEIDKLNNEYELNKKIIFTDTICPDQNDSENLEKEIFKIEKTDKNVFTESDLFKYYDNLYKVLFCYYKNNPTYFWKNSIVTHDLNTEVNIKGDAIFYNINGEYVVYNEYLKTIKYNPGYALSYQGGAQYFTPSNTFDGF